MKKKIVILLFAVLHLAAAIAIVVSFLPMAKWYFNANPLWGVDFYYTATITHLLQSNFTLPMTGWGYAWFTGWPLLSNYPILIYYLIVPFLSIYSLLDSVKLFMLVSTVLYFLGIYACCYVLSKNYIISTVISIAAIYCVGVYGALMWGGSLPSHASQAFYPWILFFIILHLQTKNNKYLFLSTTLSGIAVWSHPQIIIAYVYPSAAILYVFSIFTLPISRRILSLTFFFILSFIIGLPLIYSSFGSTILHLIGFNSYTSASSTVANAPSAVNEIVAFHMNQPKRIITDSNPALFLLLAVSGILFVFSLVFKDRIKRVTSVLPFIVLASYLVAYIWMFAYGISIYHGGWYRLFWTVPLFIGLLIASFWGAFQSALTSALASFLKKFKFADVLIITVVSIALGSYGYMQVMQNANIYDQIVKRSTYSSAFPDFLSMRNTKEGFENIKKDVVPNWLNPDNTAYRLYTGEQTINIWWNSFFKMPLARGYIDPWFPDRGYAFLVDASLNQDTKTGKDQLAGVFKYPDEVALKNTLFLVDWYAIKYFEAGPTSASYNPLPISLTHPQFMKRDEELNFNEERYTKTNQVLHYYELKDEFTSPILTATNAKTIGIVASDSGYETFLRSFADMNISSKALIPIKLGRELDSLSLQDLEAFDSLILYDYTYKNKGNAFGLVENYLKKGKKVFIDTGVEVKESASEELPSVFPIEKTYRKPLGKEWEFEISDQMLFENVDISQFDKPLFDKADWKVSYPQKLTDVRPDAKVILKSHDYPIVVSYQIGDGEVIWSGLNLSYHVIRFHNQQEIQFFKNIIQKLLGDLTEQPAIQSSNQFVSSQKRIITTKNANGILFKEQAFPGWMASIKSEKNQQGLKIYKAGPANPGFMYVRIPKGVTGDISATFTYNGSLRSWILCLITLGTIIILLEEALLGGKIIGRLCKILLRRAHTKVKSWWRREDE